MKRSFAHAAASGLTGSEEGKEDVNCRAGDGGADDRVTPEDGQLAKKARLEDERRPAHGEAAKTEEVGVEVKPAPSAEPNNKKRKRTGACLVAEGYDEVLTFLGTLINEFKPTHVKFPSAILIGSRAAYHWDPVRHTQSFHTCVGDPH
jgi:hypothetical protein